MQSCWRLPWLVSTLRISTCKPEGETNPETPAEEADPEAGASPDEPEADEQCEQTGESDY